MKNIIVCAVSSIMLHTTIPANAGGVVCTDFHYQSNPKASCPPSNFGAFR